MRGPINRVRGLTLIELLIVFMLTILVSIAVFQLVHRAWLNYESLNVQNMVQRQARTAMEIVCDELRSTNPWTPSLGGATEAANTSAPGIQLYPLNGWSAFRKGGSVWSGAFTVHREAAGSNVLVLDHPVDPLRNSAPPPNRVLNITQFDIQYQARVRHTNGIYEWSAPFSLTYRAPPSGADVPTNANGVTLSKIQRAIVTITASKTAANGLTYSRTLRSLVRIRNNFFSIVPPGI